MVDAGTVGGWMCRIRKSRTVRLRCRQVGESGHAGLTEHQVDGIRTAGVLHDLGKVSVPVELLTKPSRLTEMEL